MKIILAMSGKLSQFQFGFRSLKHDLEQKLKGNAEKIKVTL
jgi:hypothetical protein